MAGEWNYTSGKWHGDANDKGKGSSFLCVIFYMLDFLKIKEFKVLLMSLEHFGLLMQVFRQVKITDSTPFQLSSLNSATRITH